MFGNLSARVVIPCSLFLLAVTTGRASGEIKWHSGAAQLSEKDPAELATALTQLAARPDARHIVVQFAHPLAPAQREQLASAGLNMLDYLGDNAFFAEFSDGQIDVGALAAVPSFNKVSAIERSWKLHPDLIRGQIHDWSIVSRKGPQGADDEEPVVGAYVLFHPDVVLDPDALRICRLHNARIRSKLESINGLVIELPYNDIQSLADEDAVKWIEPPLPKFSELNNDNRIRTGAEIVQAAPYGLNGSGVTVLVYDGGFALAAHQDFGGRLTQRDSSGLSDHATHVSGTIGGDGSGSGGTLRGMAPAVTIESYGFEMPGGLVEGFLYTDPGDLEADYSEAINLHGADISNNSIGTNTAPNGFPCEWEGNYGVTGALIDAIVAGSLGAPFRIVWANGNERGSGRCGTTYHTTAPPACAKNHITVGALNSNNDSVTSFTSWGPTDDGRLKPDLSAPGCQSSDDFTVTSCSSSGGYTGKCGTSMSSPTVCGCSALLLQDFRAQYPGEPDFRNSTLKALLAHSAADIQNPGPDYKTGYGSIRVQAAVDLLRSGNFLEDVVAHAQTFSILVVVNPGDPQLKVTLAWDDVPGTPNVNPVLVNDLDLRVFDASNTQYYPWTLDPLNPAVDAVQNQADRVNNIEQVVINAPAPGVYRVDVLGFNVPQGPQAFSVSATPLLVACSQAGVVFLDQPKYPCSSTATIRIVDCDLNTDDATVESFPITITSDSEPAGETIILTETAAETAAFEGSIPLETTDAAGVLLIADGDILSVTYTDADDGQGGFNVLVTANAVVDCQPPLISNVQTTNLEPRSATITFTTDEPANGAVNYGTSCASLTDSAAGSGFNTSHAINLSGLIDNTTYFYAIQAADQADNQATDDNAAACYSFTTPEIPDFFTEEFGGDFDLDNLTLLFTPNGSDDHYAGCTEPILALPTDPTGGTTISLTDDDFELVTLSGGATVSLYGVSYSDFYVSSNGYITFGTGDSDYSETLAEHFDLPRVAPLYDDFNPSSAGTVSWMQLADRAVVTYQDVPEYLTTNQNTFQIELYFDGDIRISYFGIAAADGIAGLSQGVGLSPDFFETDLSALGDCGPRPPSATSADLFVDKNSEITITLLATDDGLPDPPAALSYIIIALPNQELRDAGNDQVIATLPYTLTGGGNQVIYATSNAFEGADSFQFKANDGDVAPDGGDSNLATVSLTVGGPRPVYDFLLDDTNPNWGNTGAWAFGQPAGLAGDPSSGRTGNNVYGYNLSGDYANNMAEQYLSGKAINCSDLGDVQVRFWRWLGVDDASRDHAAFQVSTDTLNWTTIWENPAGAGNAINESAWTLHVYDISAVADNQPSVYLRWVMGTTDASNTLHGWNLDDIQVWAIDLTQVCPTPCGDLDGSGGSVNLVDFATFALCFGQSPSSSPACICADLNADQAINLVDFATFSLVFDTSSTNVPPSCP